MAMILSSAAREACPYLRMISPDPITLGTIAEIKTDLYPPLQFTALTAIPASASPCKRWGNTVLVSRQGRRILDELAEEFNEQGYGISFRYVFDQARKLKSP